MMPFRRRASQIVPMCRLGAAAIILTAAIWSPGAAVLAADAPADSAAVPAAPLAAPVPIGEWLVLGPIATPLPVFHGDKTNGLRAPDLAAGGALDPRAMRPRAGDGVLLPEAGAQTWRVQAGPDLALARPAPDQPAEAWLAVHLDAARWLSAKLSVTSAHPLRAFLDGQVVKLASEAAAAPDTAAAQTATLKLVPGGHVLLVHAVGDPAKPQPWRMTASLATGQDVPAAALRTTTSPLRAQDVRDVLDAPAIASAAISPDGRYVAVALAQNDPDGKREAWVEVRRTADGGIERSWRGGAPLGQVSWAPVGARLSWTGGREGKTTIWLHDLASGQTSPIVRDVENLGNYLWGPDGTFLVYEITVKAEPDKRKVKRLENLADRQPEWRDRTYLTLATVPDGATRRLTAGEWSTEQWRIAPEGRRLLFFREWPDYGARPYAHRELWELDLRTLAAAMVLDDPWITAAEYGPDPNVLALQGAPSAFAGLGRDLPAGMVPNDYDGQLYLYDRTTAQAKAVSRDLDPDILSLTWSRQDGRIYAQVIEGQRQNVYALDPATGKWTRLDVGLEIVESFAAAERAPLALALGNGATLPPRMVLVDLKRGKTRPLLEPAAARYRDVRLGRVEDWAATLPDGEIIDGRVYYPLDFDPARQYPCIVYYYGGTSPVGRDFGGRYPKNVWAGLGYFVYVPQPSGATGYGQEMAARHVSDWGTRTAQEVIDATRAFVAAYPSVDGTKLACMGASYGGFLTEYLLTRTDLFACAVSHAGISSIASYWGEGFWGYDYGARALADAFPWSHRDLYVAQSPLYAADRIETPLLLLHGSSDTNVPPGESEQLYTALKLLGREVEYVRIEGQNHHILDRDQRILWNDTILAWLAKWLKDEPQWWADLYPD